MTDTGRRSIAIVGEAYGEQERLKDKPFVGPVGKFLFKCLAQLAMPIRREDVFLTNVFLEQPPRNNVAYFFNNKTQVKEEHQHHLIRLKKEIRAARPKVIITLGATPLFIMTKQHSLTANLSVPQKCHFWDRAIVYPLYHPGYIKRFMNGKEYQYINSFGMAQQIAQLNRDIILEEFGI